MKISEWQNTESENDSILELTKRVFGNQEISEKSYFSWQYIQNPFGNAIVTIAKDEVKDEIIGTNTIIPIEIWIDKKLIKASLACNVQVDPKYQNKGIFSKLLNSMNSIANKNNISFLYAVPNDNSYNSFIKHNSTKISSLPLYVKILKPSEYYNLKILKIFDSIWKPKKIKDSEILPYKKEFSKEFEEIMKKSLERIPIIVNRNIKFLEWRYNKHPTRKYQIFVLKENEHIKGYIIFRIAIINNKKIGIINDFLIDDNIKNKQKFKKLVDAAIENLYDNGATIVIATFNIKYIEGKIFQKSGFFKTPKFLKPESLNCIVMPFEKNGSNEKIKNFENWFFSFGDYDVF